MTYWVQFLGQSFWITASPDPLHGDLNFMQKSDVSCPGAIKVGTRYLRHRKKI
jgi:hypothetical protein